MIVHPKDMKTIVYKDGIKVNIPKIAFEKRYYYEIKDTKKNSPLKILIPPKAYFPYGATFHIINSSFGDKLVPGVDDQIVTNVGRKTKYIHPSNYHLSNNSR